MAKILIVDDQIGVRQYLQEVLVKNGHHVILAEDACTARELLASELPDLVLLDFCMPKTDGITLLKEWSDKGALSMPVIMMSGGGNPNEVKPAMKLGAFRIIQKPTTIKQLLESIKAALMVVATKQYFQLKRAESFPMKNTVFPPLQRKIDVVDLPIVKFNTSLIPPVQPFSFSGTFKEMRNEFEAKYFRFHFLNEKGNVMRVSEKTGVDRTGVYRKLKKLNINSD